MALVKLVIDIDENLRTELSIIAKRQRTTNKAIVTKLIEDFVNENKDK